MFPYGDIRLKVAPGVYPPSDDTLMLAESVRPHGRILEVGTGSGLIAIRMARMGKKVLATDLDPGAVRCARENVEANGASDKVDVVRADLMKGLRGPFDTVVFNPPYLPSRPLGEVSGVGELGAADGLPTVGIQGRESGLIREFTPAEAHPTERERDFWDRKTRGTDEETEKDGGTDIFDADGEPEDLLSGTWQGGRGGREVIDRFATELSERLSEGGRGYLTVSSLTEFDLPRESGLDYRVIAERKFPFESIYVLEIFRRSEGKKRQE